MINPMLEFWDFSLQLEILITVGENAKIIEKPLF